MNIPERIIHTWENRDLHPAAKASLTNLKLLHPDWEYLFFDNDDRRRFVTKEYPQYVAAFDAFPHRIQQVDFFRYLAILKFGGFYFDLDMYFSEGLSSLLAHNCVFPFEELTINKYLRREFGMDWEVGNYAFAAVPGDPFLSAVAENCIRSVRDPIWLRALTADIPRFFRPEYEVLNTTGPTMVTRTLAENPGLARNVTVLFPGDVCDSQNWHRFGNFAVHLMFGSWRAKKSYWRRRLAYRWESFTKARLMRESRRLGPNRRLADLRTVVQ